MTASILGYSSSQLSYELHTNALGSGLGAILYQHQQGVKRNISYANRGLTKAENYAPHKLECLALKWAVTDKFKDYDLLHFTKISDIKDKTEPYHYKFDIL